MLHLRTKLEVLNDSAASDDELVVSKRFGTLCFAGDAAVFNCPEREISIPAREIDSVEQRAKTLCNRPFVGRGNVQHQHRSSV